MGDKYTVSQNEFADLFSKYDNWNSERGAVDSEYPKDDWKYQDFKIIKGTSVRNE